MNEKVGLLSYRMDKDAFDKPYSEETAQMIDNEVRAFVDVAYKRTLAMVEAKRPLIEAMSMDLLKNEVRPCVCYKAQHKCLPGPSLFVLG